jgi:hypothetical protein
MSQPYEEKQDSKSLRNTDSEGETKEADGGTVNGRPRTSSFRSELEAGLHSEEKEGAFWEAPDEDLELKEDHFSGRGLGDEYSGTHPKYGPMYDVDLGEPSSGETKSEETSSGETKSEDTSTEAPKKDKKSIWQQVKESVVGKPKKPVPPPFKA